MDIMNRQIITQKRSLTQETEDLLNRQIHMEGTSSASYLSMASWCDKSGFSVSADFLYRHSEEERQHMLKLFGYINDAGGHALHPEITNIPHNFNSLREVFDLILDHEIAVTQSINNLVDHCFEIKDFTMGNEDLVLLFLGTITSMIVGYASLKFLQKIVINKKIHLFAYYCWAVGITIILSIVIQ